MPDVKIGRIATFVEGRSYLDLILIQPSQFQYRKSAQTYNSLSAQTPSIKCVDFYEISFSSSRLEINLLDHFKKTQWTHLLLPCFIWNHKIAWNAFPKFLLPGFGLDLSTRLSLCDSFDNWNIASFCPVLKMSPSI